ncbi:MAG: DUF1836 domain-containing protein [Clostridiales bacterium]|nr:DUF1836 domain-containing protein [Clostridiales bacterium]
MQPTGGPGKSIAGVNIPGTNLPDTKGNRTAFSMIEPLLAAAGGLSLSQVAAVTGLEGSTIQNWVKRGWVSKPIQKKYDETQLARILIISSLRDCMQIEQIVQLMAYVNGLVEDRSDDIIKESQLYNYLCEVVRRLTPEEGISLDGVRRLVREQTEDYSGPAPDSRTRLERALTVMALACEAGRIKNLADQLFHELM